MEAVRSAAWNDDRLDDLNHKVDRIDRRVDDLGRRIEERFDAQQREMNVRFDSLQREMNARFDSFQRAMFHAAIALAVSFLTAGAAIVATQI